MADVIGGSVAGDERREKKEWRCKRCNTVHGFVFTDKFYKLQLTVFPVLFEGDGQYTCPQCGNTVYWVASEYALQALMERRRDYSHGRLKV